MATDEFTEALKEAAWQVVKENPGIDCGEWIRTLLRQFPTEVVDALGTDPYDVHHILADWWDSEDYTAPDGVNDTFQGFSEYYYNDVDYLHEELGKAEHKIYELSQAVRSRDAEIKKLKKSPFSIDSSTRLNSQLNTPPKQTYSRHNLRRPRPQ